MSIIFGIFYRNGQPITDELDVMFQAMSHLPHERDGFVVKDNCGFGHMLTYNTFEARYDSMPIYVDEANLLFVAEGRVDNRDDLFSALDIPLAERSSISDGSLIYYCFRRWAELCIDKIRGKWSFAAFNTPKQSLFIARDKMDYTAVDYYINSDVIAFSTSHKGLFALPFIEKKIDELRLARLLVIWPGDFEKSIYRDVRHLLPAHTLSIDREKDQLQKYWCFETLPVQNGRPRTDQCEDQVEELFHALNQAVKVRLRSAKPVAATLSGGLDSGTVCWIAAAQLAQKQQRLQTFSHVPHYAPAASLSDQAFGDERPYITATAKSRSNIDTFFIDSAATSPLEGIREAYNMVGGPFHGAINAYWLVDLYKTVANRGFGALLTGEFGNATISWTGIDYGLPLIQSIRYLGVPQTVKRKFLRALLYGQNPVGRRFKRLKFGKRPWLQRSFCHPSLDKRLKLSKRLAQARFDAGFRPHFHDPKEHQRRIIRYNILRFQFGTAFGCETGLELRDPTADTGVMACALAIPNHLYVGKQNKLVIRGMMKGKLPDRVLFNKKKGKQSADIDSRLRAYPQDMESCLAALKKSEKTASIIDIKRLQKTWSQLKSEKDHGDIGTIAHMLRALSAAYL